MEKLEELEKRINELEKKQEVKKEEIKTYGILGKAKEEIILNDKEVKIKDFVKNLDNIYILGRGQTLGYAPTAKMENTEFWGCNNIFKAREVDRLFIMHDIYMVQFLREKDLIKEINEKSFPIYTLGKYEILKNNIQYPIEEVLKQFGTSYLINNASYMIALAILQKPENIHLFGIDMSYGTNNEYMYNEKACVEFWLGMAKGKDINFVISEGSTLLKRRGENNYYGMIEKNDGLCFRLEPKFAWGNNTGKAALRYKIVKVQHNL